MKKLTVDQKREKAMKELYDMTLSKDGAKEIARFFISTVSWNKIIEAHDELAR